MRASLPIGHSALPGSLLPKGLRLPRQPPRMAAQAAVAALATYGVIRFAGSRPVPPPATGAGPRPADAAPGAAGLDAPRPG